MNIDDNLKIIDNQKIEIIKMNKVLNVYNQDVHITRLIHELLLMNANNTDDINKNLISKFIQITYYNANKHEVIERYSIIDIILNLEKIKKKNIFQNNMNVQIKFIGLEINLSINELSKIILLDLLINSIKILSTDSKKNNDFKINFLIEKAKSGLISLMKLTNYKQNDENYDKEKMVYINNKVHFSFNFNKIFQYKLYLQLISPKLEINKSDQKLNDLYVSKREYFEKSIGRILNELNSIKNSKEVLIACEILCMFLKEENL